MVPTAFPIIPPMTVAEVFGPLAPLLVLATLAGLGVLIALIAGLSWAGRPRPAPTPRGASAWRRIAGGTIRAA